MSGTELRVQAVPAVSNPEMLESTGTIRNTETRKMRVPARYNPQNTTNTQNTPRAPIEGNFLQHPHAGPSVDAFCKQWA